MKRTYLKSITFLVSALLLFGTFQTMAQRGQMRGNQDAGYQCNIPDLTEEQQKKIDDLRTVHQRNMLKFRNQMQENRAKLNTLRTADKPDMTAINKTVDEMGNIHTQMMKEKESHIQQVRGLLTEKQKVYFDSNPHKGRMGHGMGYGMGKCKNMGNCQRWNKN